MTKPTVPSCPRCGYDLAGAVASWNREDSASCPVTGTCSECGLGFEWADVFNAERVVRRGFFEHAQGWWQRWRWAWVTWAWTLWPAVFWRKVGMKYPPRTTACLLWLAVLILPFHLLVAGSGSVARFFDLREEFKRPYERITIAPTHGGGPWRVIQSPPNSYELPWPNVISPCFEPLVELDLYRWVRPPVANYAPSEIRVAFRMAHWPLYVPPVFAMTAGFTLTVLVLPVTRRNAKIQTRHLLRAAVYGLAWIIPPIVAWELWTLGGALAKLHLQFGQSKLVLHWIWRLCGTLQDYMQEHAGVYLLIGLSWVVLWWRSAILVMFQGHSERRVFRMSAIVAGLCTLIVMLIGTSTVELLIKLIGGSWWWDWAGDRPRPYPSMRPPSL